MSRRRFPPWWCFARVRRTACGMPDPAEAFAALFPELTVHRWDPAFVEQVADLLLAVLDRVPVYRLECRPDREAVELLCARVLQEAGET